jgi:putative Mn2+ efflux pump MntP
MAGSTSECWRNRVGGLVLVAFGCWTIVSSVLLPFPTSRKIEGLPARVIGGILLLIGVVMLIQTIPGREDK